MKAIKLVSLILLISILLVGCSTIEFNYKFGDDIKLEEGKELADGIDPFAEKGLYEDPEVEIDGVREAQYDYPTGSGKHTVYESETETTYISIYKGERGIYFLFECEDDCLSCLNVEDINLVTAQSDSVELYVDTYGAGGSQRGNNQYEFRVTASGRIYSYLTGFVARVFTYGTLNDHNDTDTGFNVEGYISYSVLGDDVDKNTPTSFAFARVTKTGNKGFVWHGDVDPQVPNNYLILNGDNKFYTLETCPTSGVINGSLLDVHGNPVVGAKVAAAGYKTVYTDSDGNYSLDITDCKGDIRVSFSKKEYIDNYLTVNKADLRNAKNNTLDIGSSLFLAEAEADYSTTIKGVITERDGTTPIANAQVEVNGATATTDSNGKYSLEANLSGYNGSVSFSADNHISYTKSIGILDVTINGTTELGATSLDESTGSSINFGRENKDYATARLVRGEDSFKIVLKTESKMDILPGSNFEVFIDTEDSCPMNKRDATDYLFVFQYADEGVLSSTCYGGGSVNTRNIATKYGRLNEMYYVEVDIPYSVIGVEKDEIFGLYFGIKCNYEWTGMYDHGGDYIPAEATINYVRFDANSNLFDGSCNAEPATNLTFKEINQIGNYSDGKETVKYDVSYARDGGYVMLKFDLVEGLAMTAQSHSINIYFDMSCDGDKSGRDTDCYHLTIYPGRAVSVYNGWDESKGQESTKKYYESDSDAFWAYLYGDTIYVKLDTAIFGGEADANIGFGIGMWNDVIGGNSILSMDGTTCSFDNPTHYFIVDSEGNISIK